MNIDDFDFDLPEDLIALRPAVPRRSARLLVAQQGEIAHRVFSDLPTILRPGDRLVLNDTKVIPARLSGIRRRASTTGSGEARIDVTLLEPQTQGRWNALLRPLRKVKIGEVIEFRSDFRAQLIGVEDGVALLEFEADQDLDEAIDAVGRMPLPPYIETKRPADDQDLADYQTVWARNRGAVAAPTASLHFDDQVLSELAANGIDLTYVTLHVGAGTFLPVKVANPRQHRMHAEVGEITEDAAEELNETRARGGRIIPVGTTALRLLETAAQGGSLKAWQGATDIFILPGHKFQATDALITNFHLPRSTLVMLVSALMGVERIREVYASAIAGNYRFFSYGDSSLLVPDKG